MQKIFNGSNKGMDAAHRPQDCNSLSYGVTGLSC